LDKDNLFFFESAWSGSGADRIHAVQECDTRDDAQRTHADL